MGHWIEFILLPVIVLALWIPIGASVFRAACRLHDGLGGEWAAENNIEEPTFREGLAIVGVAALAALVAHVVAGLAFESIILDGPRGPDIAVMSKQVLPALISVPFSILVMVGMTRGVLQVSIARSLLATLLYTEMMFVIGMALACVLNFNRFLIVLLAVVLCGSWIGAVVLQCSCWLYNQMTDPARSVPKLSLARALGIVAVGFVTTAMLQFGVQILLKQLGLAEPPDLRAGTAGAQWLSLLLALVGMLSVMAAANIIWLPTTFLRGLAIAALFLFSELMIGLVLFGVTFAVFMIWAVFKQTVH